MTPKEKAQYLFDEFYGYVHDYNCSLKQNKFNTKQCALISVDEVLKTIKKLADNEGTDWGESEFWDEVKLELEKL